MASIKKNRRQSNQKEKQMQEQWEKRLAKAGLEKTDPHIKETQNDCEITTDNGE